ncbi:hypothetical protein SteCoe_11014 [Stentor coeruleus]|uniref:ALMS motif domain-containing protein n=1 Tax=Stentor coeruleus TaxID=5963 RepID=A0A1R2CEE8_9CILI|nr:hypothetical protein SteCoe_11014 [Stentor coeruleus]
MLGSDAANRAKQQRILAVRKQEAMIARQSSQSYRGNKQSENQIQNLERVKNDKVKEIETLLKQKEHYLANLGKAQEAAQQERRVQEENMRARDQFLKEAEIKAKERGQAALRLQLELDQKRIDAENELKERKAEIIKHESEIAHDLAQKFREKQAIIDEQKRIEELENYIRPGGTVMYGKIDYSQTHFHNPIILKHDFEGRTAKENAEEETEQAILRFQEKEQTKIFHQQKAEERGENALLQVHVDRELAKLNRQLEKFRKADGDVKIKRGMNDNTLQNRCIVKETQDKFKKQLRLERMFEEMCIEANGNTEVKDESSEVVEDEKADAVKNVFEIPMPKIDTEGTNQSKLSEKGIKTGQYKTQEPRVNPQKEQTKQPKQKLLMQSEDNEEKKLKQTKSSKADFESQDLEYSVSSENSESSDHDVLPAKYNLKASRKGKKPKKHHKKLQKPNKSFEQKEKPENFHISDDDKFKQVLETEYQKHLQIKKDLESLKKYNPEPVSTEKKETHARTNAKYDPPSVLSSQISPKSPAFTKTYEEPHEDHFQVEADFPVKSQKKGDYYDYPSDYKNEYSVKPPSSSEKLNKTPGFAMKYPNIPEKSEDQSGNSISEEEDSGIKSNSFLEEMKLKYGLIQKSEKKPEKPIPEELSEEQSVSNSEKDVSENIFSQRTINLMKEIEEKYSLDKYKTQDNIEDYRFDMPFSKPQQKWEEARADSHVKSLEDYIGEYEEDSEKVSEEHESHKKIYEKSSEDESEENYHDEEEDKDQEDSLDKVPDSPVREVEDEKPRKRDFAYNIRKYQEKYLDSKEQAVGLVNKGKEKEKEKDKGFKPSFNNKKDEIYEENEENSKSEQEESDDEKYVVNNKFFDEIKNKYGFGEPKKEKGFNYKFDFEKKKDEEEEEEEDEEDEEENEEEEEDKHEIGESESDYSENSGLRPKIHSSKGELIDFNEDKGKSLADIFKERNKKAAEKLDKRDISIPKTSHKEKSKEELLEIRKEMMKGKAEKSKKEETQVEPKKLLNPALERLGKGEKPKISKKEMHDLTKKNYELLPEVKKRKEEERKKQEMLERLQKSKEFDKVINIQKRQEKKK